MLLNVLPNPPCRIQTHSYQIFQKVKSIQDIWKQTPAWMILTAPPFFFPRKEPNCSQKLRTAALLKFLQKYNLQNVVIFESTLASKINVSTSGRPLLNFQQCVGYCSGSSRGEDAVCAAKTSQIRQYTMYYTHHTNTTQLQINNHKYTMYYTHRTDTTTPTKLLF